MSQSWLTENGVASSLVNATKALLRDKPSDIEGFLAIYFQKAMETDTLYTFELSNTGNLCRWFMEYSGIPLKVEQVVLVAMQHQTPEFLAVNAKGKIPALKTGMGDVVTESSGILHYLANKHGSPLWPSHDAKLFGEVMSAFEFVRHGAWAHANHGQWHVVAEPIIYGTTPNMDEVAANHKLLMDDLAVIETLFFKDSPNHLVGTKDSVADLALATVLAYNQIWSFNRAGVDLSKAPKVEAFLNNMKATDHFKASFGHVGPFIEAALVKGDSAHPAADHGLTCPGGGAKDLGEVKKGVQHNQEGDITLYGFELSNTANLCKWFMETNGISHKVEQVLLVAKAHQTPEYLAVNPNGKIPVLKDSAQGADFLVRETSAIIAYLANKFNCTSVLPTAVAKHGEVMAAFDYIRHEVWPYASHGQWHVVAEPIIYGSTPNMEEVTANHVSLMKVLAIVEELYFKGSPNFLVGKAFTVADMTLAVVLAMNQIWSFNRAGVDLSKVPKVQAWLNATKETAGFKTCFAPVATFLKDVIVKGDAAHPAAEPGF